MMKLYKRKFFTHFQDPEPLDFNPKKGPRSGGTNVNITGNNMNTGRYITVQVAGRQCLVDRNKLVSLFNVVLFDECKKPTSIHIS